MHGLEIHTFEDLELSQQAGAHWLRRNALLWNALEPVPGARHWENMASLEAELQRAAELGQEVILIVRGTPGWAQQAPGISCGPVRADQLPAFAAFLADAVARYSAPPFNVKYWELGNEPDVATGLVAPDEVYGCWGDPSDPYYGGSYYAEMLAAVYPRIKTANPQAQVLVGGLLLDCDPVNPPETSAGSGEFRDCSPSRFLEGILIEGGEYFDGVSFHAYDYYDLAYGQYHNPNWHSSWDTTGPVLIAKAHYLRSLLDQYGHTTKYLVNTEVALICGRTGDEPPCQDETFQRTKANYLAQSYAAAQAAGLRANLWYSLRGWRSSGLVDGALQPLIAYQAYQASVEKVGRAAFLREVNEYPGVRGYEFVRQGTRLWVLWSQDGANHVLSLPEAPGALFDVLSAPLPVAQELTLTLDPVYVEWRP